MIRTVLGTSDHRATVEDLCGLARTHAFEAVALTLGGESAVLPAAGEAECARIRSEIEEQGLRVSAAFLTSSSPDRFGVADDRAFSRAVNVTARALEQASWLGAHTLVVVPAIVAGESHGPGSAGTYADALNRTHQALQRLRFAAERSGVTIALTAARHGFLLSPVELRELLDEQHLPSVGACLDLDACRSVGSVRDWIETLGQRVHCMVLGGRRSALERPTETLAAAELATVRDALATQGFAGPICCTGEDTIQTARAILGDRRSSLQIPNR
jgi:sugar phosphate isomerase/epimerase